jgi:hypothetical protein
LGEVRASGKLVGGILGDSFRQDGGAAVDGHVIYESRLEVARLLYADFDPSVNRIVARRMLANMSDLRTWRR